MPIKNSGYTQVKAHARQERKRQEADLRQGKYDALTVAEKVALAISRGGSKQEIARLTELPKAKPVTAPSVSVAVAPKAEVFVSDKKRKGKKEVNAINKMARPAKS